LKFQTKVEILRKKRKKMKKKSVASRPLKKSTSKK